MVAIQLRTVVLFWLYIILKLFSLNNFWGTTEKTIPNSDRGTKTAFKHMKKYTYTDAHIHTFTCTHLKVSAVN